ncbi:hypothetical protein DY000_02016304 [Brassica cretica]|uniref:Uncharacterized protein n=1 Tax=Brassica cretica TaxID=69181 RepID=A0ABQ7CZZ9_BRACR|nr:hypothetical protein DY000_02016304 [Brassica cretica]
MKRGFLGPSKKEPSGLRTIRKSTREVSIDILQATVIDKVNQKSIDRNTTPSIEVLILSPDKNEVLRDEEGRARNSAGQLIHTDRPWILPTFCHELHMRVRCLAMDGDLPTVNQHPVADVMFVLLKSRLSASLEEAVEEMKDYRSKLQHWDERHGIGEPRRATEAETSDPTSTLIDTTPATSINTNTSMSIDISTSESIDIGTSETIDTDFCHRSIPLEIPERSSCPQDIANSTHKSTDVSSCSPSPDVEKEITIEDFFKLEEFLELEDGEKLEDLYSKKKLDDDQHTSRGDLETSKAIIDRHQPDEIDRHPPHRPPIWTEEAAGFHKKVKRIHDPVKIVVPCAVFEAETSIPPDRSMQFSSYIVVLDDHPHVEASHRGLRFRDEVDKGPAEATSIDTDLIPSNDTNKPASIDITTSPSTDTGRVSEQKEFDVCRNLRDGDTTTRSDKKSRMRSKCISKPFAKLSALLIAEMIDNREESMEEAFT